MLIELGNHAPHRAVDGAPCVTTLYVPEADENGLGGYTHAPGALSVDEFRRHRSDATDYRGGITQLPDHELLLSVVAAWPSQGREKPAWAKVTSHEETHGETLGHDPKAAEDVENFLREFYGIDASASKPPEDELQSRYHTKAGPPGRGFPAGPPPISNLFTNDGRTQQAVNYGGGQVAATGQASASSATTLTTASTYTTNQWAGYRVYASVSASQMVWGNVISNTNAASASVLTVDRWYSASTPGGAAGSTPSATATFIVADGGSVSAWFIALTTTNITPAAGDHSLTGEYTTASGGYVRKISPYALTSGTSPMTFTLTPVFTGNGSDSYPSTFFAIGVFNSMVVADTTLTMKFETSLNASATVAASGDQITVTETVTGS